MIIAVPQENEESLKEIETSPEPHVRLIQYVPLNMKFAAHTALFLVHFALFPLTVWTTRGCGSRNQTGGT